MTFLTGINTKLILAALIQSFLGTSSYYCVIVLNPIEPWVKSFAHRSVLSHYSYYLTSYQLAWVWSVISGSVSVGCLVGALTLKQFFERVGRRDTYMLIKNVIFLVGATMQVTSKPFNAVELLIFGRFLTGIAIMQTIAVSAFMAECCPNICRGFLTSLPTIGKKGWLVFGAFFAMPLSGVTEQNWNLIMFYPIVPSFLHLLSTPFIPRSPKHLYITENNEREADEAILFYHGLQTNIEEVKAKFRLEAEAGTSVKAINLRTIFKARHLRWPMLLSVAATLMLPLGGSDIAALYSTGVMQMVGIPAQSAPYTVFVLQLLSIFACIVAMLLLDRWGRRPLLLLGCTGAVSGMALVSMATPMSLISPMFTNFLTVIGFALIFFGNSIGPSIVCHLLPGELAPQASRSATVSFSGIFDWAFAIVIILCFPPLHHTIGSYAAMPMAVAGGFVSFFLYRFLPETKGKEVGEIVQIWMKEDKNII